MRWDGREGGEGMLGKGELMGSGNYSYELNGQNINIIFIKFGICTTLFGINIFFFPPESVQKLLQEIDPFLSQHLAICDVGDLMFCHR